MLTVKLYTACFMYTNKFAIASEQASLSKGKNLSKFQEINSNLKK